MDAQMFKGPPPSLRVPTRCSRPTRFILSPNSDPKLPQYFPHHRPPTKSHIYVAVSLAVSSLVPHVLSHGFLFPGGLSFDNMALVNETCGRVGGDLEQRGSSRLRTPCLSL